MKRRHSDKVSIRIHNVGTPLISRSTGSPIESLHVESDRPYTIGRSTANGSCDFVLDHVGISRNHCQILFDSQSRKLYVFDGVILSNSGGFSQFFNEVEKEGLRFKVSLNGVYVNRVKVRKGRVQEVLVGDEVLFVCGKEGLLCYKDGRVGFVVQEIGFEGRDASVSEGHSRGSFSSGKRSKRVFAPMENEVSSLVSGVCRRKAVGGVVERLNSLVRYCRHVLNSDDPVSCLRVSDSGKECVSCCTMLRLKGGIVADNREVRSDEVNDEMGHGLSRLKASDEQPSPKLQVESDGAICISVSDKARTMLPFDGEKENTPNISYINKEKSCQSSLQTPGKNFYLNRLQYIEQDPTGSQRMVSLPELLHPVESISQIFIATFTSDILWFLTGCEIPSHLPVTVACHHAERCWSSSPDARTSAPLPNYPNVVMVFPPFPEEIAFGKDRKNRGIACHHPKLFILQREDSIRVIITSANLVARQWDDVTNTVWWQDFPRRANPDYLSLFSHFKKETNRGLSSDFGAQLAGFAATLLADVPSQAHWILEFTKYNFEHSAGHLVASVPGVHSYKPSYLTESVRSSTAFNEEFLGSVEASVVGLSYLFRSTSDSTGAQLKRLASYISRTRENSLGMLELVMRRNTNVPADVNAVSVLVPNPDDDSRDEFVQLGFLPRNIAKWVSPLWDIGSFKFVGYVYRDEVLAAASCRSNQKVQLMLHVLQGVSISEMPKLINPHHVVALCSLIASLQRCTGIWRLQEVLGCYKWPESQESDFVYSASSVGGSVTAGFQADFASAAGKKMLQHFDSQESDPEWGCWSAREEREAPSIKIIFPTIERVKNGQHGVLSSRRLLCFSEKTWQKLRYNNVLHDAVPNPQDRVGHPMHIKVARRRFTSTGSRSSSFGWVYCGSHNFSAAAWGQTISRSSRTNQDQSYNATRSVSKLRVCNYELGIVFVFPPPHEEKDSCDGSKIDDIVLPFVVPAPKYGGSDRPATGLAMREALAEFREGSTSVFGESEVEKATEVEASDKEKALGLIRNQIKSEEKTLIELRTSLEHTGNELELKKAELKKTGNEFELKKAELEHTGNELELKKTELKNTEIRLRSSVLVKHETQPIAAEPELSTGDAFLLHELSTIGLERHEVSSYLRAISNPAKFVPDLVDRQLRTAYRRQKLGCLQESLLKNLVLFLEELAGIGGSEKPQLQFKAKELASTWKENITIEAPISSLEALAFLLFIVAFGLKSLINEEEAALLASSVFHYTQGPKLFQFFGLKRKIPEFVRDLIKDHQYIPAVRIICLLDLKDFSATTLLMKEITVLRHSAMGKVQNKYVGRLRAIVELVADYKLDIDLPGELIAKLVFLRENSTPPELHCSVEVAEETCTSSSNPKAACSGVHFLVPKRETKPLVNPMY